MKIFHCFGSGFNWIMGLYNKLSLEPYQFNGRKKGTRDKPSLLWLLNRKSLDFDDFRGLLWGYLGNARWHPLPPSRPNISRNLPFHCRNKFLTANVVLAADNCLPKHSVDQIRLGSVRYLFSLLSSCCISSLRDRKPSLSLASF
jgi:hypothetical protein